MNDCIFCKIIDGEMPSHKVYESENIFAFLSTNPINEGHTLIIPKQHIEDFYDVPDSVMCEISSLAQTLAKKLKVTYSPVRIGMLAAGFDIPHTHIHVLPMHDYNDLTSKKFIDQTTLKLSEEKMKEITSILKQ